MTQSSNNHSPNPATIGVLYAGALSLTLFWIMIILKGAYSAVENFLNWYSPVGPLLGLFGIGLLAFFLTNVLFRSQLEQQNATDLTRHQKRAVTLFMVAAVLVLFMTFPPIFEPIVNWLS